MGSSSSHTHSHTKNKTKNNKNCVHIRKASDSMRSDGDIHYNFVMTTCWINNQTRPEEFSRASSFTCLGEETRKSKTIVVKAVEKR
jgi:hypothetical protein